MEVLRELGERREVELRVERRPAHRPDHRLGRRLAGPAGEGGERGVDRGRAGLGDREAGHGGHPARRMRVDDHRESDLGDERADERPALLGRHESAHVLHADLVGPHLGEAAAEPDERLEGVDRRLGVADRPLGPGAGALHGLHRDLHVARVVEGVEDPKDVDPLTGRFADELADDVVGVVPVADEVLSPQQHLERRPGHRALERAQTLPRVLVQEPEADVERGSAPHLDRAVADRVEALRDRQHVARAHPGRDERLMTVPAGPSR